MLEIMPRGTCKPKLCLVYMTKLYFFRLSAPSHLVLLQHAYELYDIDP